MAAYSVTGTGPGSALKEGQKGAESMNLGVERLIGPRVIYADTVTLASGAQAVVFPQPLLGINTDYVVFTGGSAAYSYASAVTVNGFTLNGTSGQTVSYVVVRKTTATVTID